MSAFEPGPEHRFAFGLRTVVDPHEPWEFVYRLGDIGGIWGVGFHDDDLVPAGASLLERDDIVDKVSKALDSTGMVVSIAKTSLSRHPVFDHGAFTSADRDVRRYAIQKTMRAIELGAELGAELHELSGGREGIESVAAKPPLDALDRFREAVDFLCGYVREQRYPTQLVLQSTPHERRGDSLLSTIGHALAFIDTLEHPEMVGINPRIVHGTIAGSSGFHGVAQAIDAHKLFHIDLNTRPVGCVDGDPTFGAASLSEAFFLVKLLAEAGYDGPLHFEVDATHFDHPDGIWDFALGCMRTYRALAAKARRYADDPEIRDALTECGALELSEPSVGPFSAEAGRALSTECFDPREMSHRRYREQRLDQLVVDLVLGLR